MIGTTKMDAQLIKQPLYIHQADMKKVIYHRWDTVLPKILPTENSEEYFKLICEGRLVMNRHEEVMRAIETRPD